MKLPNNKTKIVCTIGPASSSPETMEKMIRAGMNVARINFSHGELSDHAEVITKLRAAAEAVGRRIAIMADLPGPKMRVGRIEAEPLRLKPGDIFCLTTDEVPGDYSRVSVSFSRLPHAVKAGDMLYLNDGIIQMEVQEVSGTDVRCRVIVGGELRSRKGLNLPGIDLGISAFTDNDFKCLKFALENGVDAVSQSFVESADDINAVREAANSLGYKPFIIAKIERVRALGNIDDILSVADGIMIARGDLGVELPIEQIAVVQKQIMRKANSRSKPVITATQMLESMTSNSRPTRAEATDVANAILDGTDCVMLSAESAMGAFPVEATSMLAKIAAAIEPTRPDITAREMINPTDSEKLAPARLIDLGVDTVLDFSSPAAVFVPTHSGAMARHICRFKLPVWVVAMSSQESTCRNLQFSYGVFAVNEPEHPGNWKRYVRTWMETHEMEGDMVLLTEGPSSTYPEANHRLEIISLEVKK